MFTLLTIEAFELQRDNRGRGRTMALCRCACGARSAVDPAMLRRGTTKSCGCYRVINAREMSRRPGWMDGARAATTTHGMTRKVPEYSVWVAMRRRCQSASVRNWHRYGGRGISVCERWSSFSAFYADMGPRPSRDHSIDRIDNDGPYSPENCRWATKEQQRANQQRTIKVTIGGVTLPFAEAVRVRGRIPGVHQYIVAWRRLRRGWSPEQALGLAPPPPRAHEMRDDP